MWHRTDAKTMGNEDSYESIARTNLCDEDISCDGDQIVI